MYLKVKSQLMVQRVRTKSEDFVISLLKHFPFTLWAQNCVENVCNGGNPLHQGVAGTGVLCCPPVHLYVLPPARGWKNRETIWTGQNTIVGRLQQTLHVVDAMQAVTNFANKVLSYEAENVGIPWFFRQLQPQCEPLLQFGRERERERERERNRERDRFLFLATAPLHEAKCAIGLVSARFCCQEKFIVHFVTSTGL